MTKEKTTKDDEMTVDAEQAEIFAKIDRRVIDDKQGRACDICDQRSHQADDWIVDPAAAKRLPPENRPALNESIRVCERLECQRIGSERAFVVVRS